MAIQNARSNISGHVPTSIPNDGQIFIQQADDILFTRKPDGTFRRFLLPKLRTLYDASYTVKPWDTNIGIITLTGPHTIQLPLASDYPQGHALEINDNSASCSADRQITIIPSGTDRINGAVSLPYTTPSFGCRLFSDGSANWTAPQYTANNSAALAAAVTAAQSAQTAAETAAALVGQGRLIFASPTQLAYNRESGRLVFVNGAARQIPAPGVTCDNTGLMGQSVAFAYLYMNGANLALETSTTYPAQDPTYGHWVKAGDSSRTLVGVTFTAGASNAAGTFRGGCCTLSFHSRKDVTDTTGIINPSTSASGFTALAGSVLQGLCWWDETLDAEFTGTGATGNNNAGVYANMRTIIGEPTASAPSVYGPPSKAGGAAFVAGGVASRVVSRTGAIQAFAMWAQGFGDAGQSVVFNISGILKTRG